MKKSTGKTIIRVFIHVIAWLFFLSLLTSLVPKPPNMNPVLSIVIPDLLFISFFYINYYIFVPRLFVTGRYFLFSTFCGLYLAITIAIPSSFSGSYGIPELKEPPDRMESEARPLPPAGMAMHSPRDQDRFPPDFRKPPFRIKFFIPEFSYTIIVFLFILALSTAIRILFEWQAAEKEKMQAKLSLLKAQINPHFLFNTLNSIHALAVTGDKKTPEAIEFFSDLMRYVLYESNHDFIPLDKKLGYIDTYISLQKMRLPSNVNVKYEKRGESGDLKVAPLTLFPFIENAFKYGVSTEKECYIHIELIIGENDLELSVRNSKTGRELNHDASQVGIENTLKRLGYLYPGKYEIKIDDALLEYNVYLRLRLK